MRVWPAVAWKRPAAPGLTPLVGREQEVGLLRERWAQVKDGLGQVVLLSGEAGIGKSRLVQVLKEQVAAEPQAWLTPCQCSPYHQNTRLVSADRSAGAGGAALRAGGDPRAEAAQTGGVLVQYGLPLAEAVPLFAALLSLPLPTEYAPLTLSPEQQKQQTLQALLTILLRIAAQQPVLFVMEDLHWVDPVHAGVPQPPGRPRPHRPHPGAVHLSARLSARPGRGASHLTQVTLHRLPRRQAAEMIRPGGARQGAAPRGGRSRSWPRPMGCRCSSRS